MRSFRFQAGVFAALLSYVPLGLAGPADVIYFGGPIITMDEQRPSAEPWPSTGASLPLVRERRRNEATAVASRNSAQSSTWPRRGMK